MSEIFKVAEKFSSIDIEDLKAKECRQKFSMSIVDSIQGRFQDSIESIKNRVKNFLDTSQGEISLCLFDSVLGGKKNLGTKQCGMKKNMRRQLLLPR